ncbi:MAG TPA: D-alanyl-D-alanine carboxypeptidase/D-alanyl-D-alanine-endopeptidase, partial [Chryseobacterium sp.]|nr:D-alanyl-D-alanine carboxypeptidase/D-alanyl-D-alanine-endopeptidase [Chryseobacterium sp.]
MIRLKNIFLAQALAFSAIAFGQGTFASNYPQTYDNRPSSTVKDFSSPEKLMSA